MKRKLRILRIWYYGKLPYAKKVKRWMKGQLFRDLHKLVPNHIEKIIERYGIQNYITMFEQFMQR